MFDTGGEDDMWRCLASKTVRASQKAIVDDGGANVVVMVVSFDGKLDMGVSVLEGWWWESRELFLTVCRYRYRVYVVHVLMVAKGVWRVELLVFREQYTGRVLVIEVKVPVLYNV